MKTILSCLVFLVASSISVQAMMDYSKHFDQSSPNIWADRDGKHNIVRMVNDQRLKEVEYMLQNGADVNHKTGVHVSHKGNLITLAIFQRNIPMIELLFTHGASKPEDCTTENFNSFVKRQGSYIQEFVTRCYPAAESITPQEDTPMINDINTQTSSSSKSIRKSIQWISRKKAIITWAAGASLALGLIIWKYKLQKKQSINQDNQTVNN